jgi:hypothetical protein
MRLTAASALALGVAVVTSSGAAAADDPANGASPPAQNAAGPSDAPAPSDSGSSGESAAPKKPAAPMAGYAYGDKATVSRGAAPRPRFRKTGPVVNMPGFEQTGDGGSRFFVQLSQNVAVEERKARGSVTYVLKGASPRVYNNTNALVTVHFNTPVSRARLVPKGKDLLFVIDLRADVAPTWKMSDGPEKSSVLTIDFPKGDFLPAAAPADANDSAEGESSDEEGAAPAKAAPQKRAAGKPAPTKAAPAAPPGPKP